MDAYGEVRIKIWKKKTVIIVMVILLFEISYFVTIGKA